jgi:hypothetical protein
MALHFTQYVLPTVSVVKCSVGASVDMVSLSCVCFSDETNPTNFNVEFDPKNRHNSIKENVASGCDD